MLPQRPPLDWRREYLPIRQRYSEPNIKGTMRGIRRIDTMGQAGSEGALRWDVAESTTRGYAVCSDDGKAAAADINFNASSSNTIFSDSATTVRPEAFRAYSLIRYS